MGLTQGLSAAEGLWSWPLTDPGWTAAAGGGRSEFAPRRWGFEGTKAISPAQLGDAKLVKSVLFPP
jgi:hypothetical protein